MPQKEEFAMSDIDKLNLYFSHSTADGALGCSGHYHGDYEIYYLKSGECNYFIDNAIYPIYSGDTVIIPSGVIHNTSYESKNHIRYLINCPENLIPNSAREKLKQAAYVLRGRPLSQEIEELMKQIGKEYDGADEYSAEAIPYLIGRLFILIARNAIQRPTDAQNAGFVEKTLEFIKENYTQDISLYDAAKRFSVSAEHLSRSFKERTGFGFSEYINILRLKLAEYMLIHEPGKSVSEIAYACGYNDSNYFSSKFKKAYGTPPNKWRRKC